MNHKIQTIGLIILILFLIVLSGCSTKYVCYDGTQKSNPDDCPKYPRITVDENRAAIVVKNYGQGYAIGTNMVFTMVNIFVKEGNWYSDVLFSDRITSEKFEVRLQIDGRTSAITCISGCELLGKEDQNSNSADSETVI